MRAGSTEIVYGSSVTIAIVTIATVFLIVGFHKQTVSRPDRNAMVVRIGVGKLKPAFRDHNLSAGAADVISPTTVQSHAERTVGAQTNPDDRVTVHNNFDCDKHTDCINRGPGSQYCDIFQRCSTCTYCMSIEADPIGGGHTCPSLCFESANDKFLEQKKTPDHLDHRIFVRHMRKAGGTTVVEHLKTSTSCKVSAAEYSQKVPRGGLREVFSITHFRDPISRFLSACVFEGLQDQCWRNRGKNESLCLPRLKHIADRISEFPTFVNTSLANQRVAFEKQNVMGSNDPTRRFSKLGITNYYVRTLLATFKSRCGTDEMKGSLSEMGRQNLVLSECHVNHAFKIVQEHFDRVVMFVYEQPPLTVFTELGRLRVWQPSCLTTFNWSHWEPWSAWYSLHKIGSIGLDAFVNNALHKYQHDIAERYPQTMAQLRYHNRFDIALFGRLLAFARNVTFDVHLH